MRRWSVAWLMARLTALSVLVGLITLLSYAAGANMAVRYLSPAFGEWWDRNDFWLMAGSASALGILIGLRIGARMIDDSGLRSRAAGASLIMAALALAWLTPACAALARMGWNAGGFALGSRMVGFAGYGAGFQLDKLLIAGVYFLKTVGFALLLGLALFGATLAVFLATGGRPVPEREAGAGG